MTEWIIDSDHARVGFMIWKNAMPVGGLVKGRDIYLHISMEAKRVDSSSQKYPHGREKI
jgi:hypothetical protein